MRYKSMFPKIKGRVLRDEPLFNHTTFRIGGPCRAWVEPSDEEDLRKILRFAASRKEKIFTIGMGSNVLFGEKGFNGILIHLGAGFFKQIKFSGTKAVAGAGVPLGHLVNLSCGRGLSGLEGLVGIPGTLGGAISMNSSYKGSVSDCLEEVKVMEKAEGHTRIIKRKNLKFAYRDSGDLRGFIILEAALRLKKGRREELLRRKNALLAAKRDTQPLGSFSAGCVFKNPGRKFSAAKFIEMSRLKGKRIGDAKISEKHANFIVNLKSAKRRDVLRLIKFAKERVKSRFNVELTPEIIIV
jgi:UDP-N-acetylmuramate dehydrogenase